MPERPTTPPRTKAALACVSLLISLALPGCRATTTRVGEDRGIRAHHAYRTLRTTLYERPPIRGVAAATNVALRDRGYTVAVNDASDDKARIEAWPSATTGRWGEKPFDRVIVNILPVKAGTQVQVTIDPAGNQAMSRAILDDILGRIGY